MTIAYIIFTPAWILGLLLFFFLILYKGILTPYRLTTLDIDFQELLITLNAAIQTELDLWEKDVFISKKAITNQNFDNFYHEITMHIIDSLSPTFFKRMSCYLTEEAVITIIGRKTKEYLTTKVTGTV